MPGRRYKRGHALRDDVRVRAEQIVGQRFPIGEMQDRQVVGEHPQVVFQRLRGVGVADYRQHQAVVLARPLRPGPAPARWRWTARANRRVADRGGGAAGRGVGCVDSSAAQFTSQAAASVSGRFQQQVIRTRPGEPRMVSRWKPRRVASSSIAVLSSMTSPQSSLTPCLPDHSISRCSSSLPRPRPTTKCDTRRPNSARVGLVVVARKPRHCSNQGLARRQRFGGHHDEFRAGGRMGQLMQVRFAQGLEHMQEAPAHFIFVQQLESRRDRRRVFGADGPDDQFAPIGQAKEFGSFGTGHARRIGEWSSPRRLPRNRRARARGATPRGLQRGRAGRARVLNLAKIHSERRHGWQRQFGQDHLLRPGREFRDFPGQGGGRA